jgi:hypothetical protein
MYFCGLKGMMPGITGMLEEVCTKKGIDFESKLKEWKKAGQWHGAPLPGVRTLPCGCHGRRHLCSPVSCDGMCSQSRCIKCSTTLCACSNAHT